MQSIRIKKINITICILVFAYLFYCCKSKESIVNDHKRINLKDTLVIDTKNDSRDTLWIKDTIGCLEYRIVKYKKILENEKRYIGKTEKEIKEIFGEPNYYRSDSKYTRFVYYLGVSPNCELIYSEHLTWEEIEATMSMEFLFTLEREGKFVGFVILDH